MISRRRVAMWVATGGLVVAGTMMAATPMLSHVALAAEPATTPTTKTEVRGRDGAGGDTYLAQALGITTEQLTAARETARLAAIDQALAQGLITQAQADALKNNDRSVGRGGFGGFMGKSDIDQDALLAQALGISVEKLDQAKATARDAQLAQAVTDGKITQEQADLAKAKQALNNYMVEKNVYSNAVNQAVKDGVITQAQADAILAQGKGGFGGRGSGDMGGRGGHGQKGGGTQGAGAQGTGL